MSEDPLADFPVIVEIPVQWGDMDVYGHVNNTVYFRFFESARIRYLERCGFVDSYERERVGAILHSTECRFRRPLTYPDAVRAGARVARVEEDRFEMVYRIVSTARQSVAADGAGLVVSFDYEEGSKAPLPDPVREGIEALERGRTKDGA